MEKSATLRMNEQMQDFVAHGIPALNLGFGECGLPVLPVLRELVAAGSAENAYPAVQGSLAARRAIAGYFSRRGIPSEAGLCTVAPGSKPILYALLATLSGDLVLPRPSWVSYANQSRALGKPVIWVDAPADCGGIPDPDQLEAALDEARAAGRDPRILLLTSPDNPTGTVAGGEQMRALVRIAAEQNLTIISDEIYRDLAYSPADYVSPAELAPDRTIVTSGLSKNLALGGWRVGVARFPVTDRGREQLARFVGFASELWSGMPVFLEPVVEYTFSEPADVVERIAASRRLHQAVSTAIAGVLRDAGARVGLPEGGFYLYPSFRGTALAERLHAATDEELSSRLLDRERVGVLPGTCFGDDPTQLRVRVVTAMVYGASDPERLATLRAADPLQAPPVVAALERLRNVLA
jgi:aspartate/methionine/tyrosine aminotransferase